MLGLIEGPDFRECDEEGFADGGVTDGFIVHLHGETGAVVPIDGEFMFAKVNAFDAKPLEPTREWIDE